VTAALLALVCAACAAPLQRPPANASPSTADDLAPGRVVTQAGRPTVGVAFGGGSARGIAHVGVIRWFEEHRIPIDMAAGTSMGGLIGGAFASGMDPAELQSFIAGLNWDQLFGPRRLRTRTSGARPTRVHIRPASSSASKAESCHRPR